MSSFDEKFKHLAIPLETIKSATNNFADENLIRQGGFGKIYRGRLLMSGKLIDIVARRLDPEYGLGIIEFRTEILMLSSLKNHKYVAYIVGFCDDNGEKIIVNKYEAKGSLDQYLSDPITLTWSRRLQICVGIARALSFVYYDEGRNFSVIHRNLKSSKILLDENWEAKVSGFELSKIQPVARKHLIILDRDISGTYAYADPAYLQDGNVSYKSDLYSLGVVFFEVLCGRKAFIQDNNHERPSPQLDLQLSDWGMIGGKPSSFNNASPISFLNGPPPYMTGLPGTYLFDNGRPPLYSGWQPPSFRNIVSLMQPPSLGDIHPLTSTQTSISYSLMEPYMITMKNLKYLHIPKDGLLAQLAKSHYEEGKLDDIILPGLRKQIDSQSLKIFTEVAYWCLKDKRGERPNIGRIIFALEKALDLQFTREKSEHLIDVVEGASTNQLEGKDLEDLKIGLDDIKLATENFAEKYCIGSGGYGIVYKTELEHFDSSAIKGKNQSKVPRRRSSVAIKYIFHREDTQGEEGFITEIKTLTSCKHQNIVSLLGFCYECPHMILVYPYMSNGSLEDYLGSQGKMTNLSWVQRIQICIDIARGLDYIHTTIEDKQKIIHRDIKSANILLGENWEAKIADFGLSKIHPTNYTASTLNTNKIVGTRVYWDPEYERSGKLKKESDIYSFGVVLFEILSGRLAYDKVYTDEDEKGLAPIARKHFKKGTLKILIDPKLKEETDESTFALSKGPNQDSLDTFSTIAYQCVAETQAQRPTMKVVIKELEKALNFQVIQKDSLRVSFEDISLATQNFKNLIGKGGFGNVYIGEVVRSNGPTNIAVKRLDMNRGQGELEFLRELELLFEYKHENIIGLVGYCDGNNEKIIVTEYASNRSLDSHLEDASLTWLTRLQIGIDVATGLHFLHGGDSRQDVVIHRDIKSSNILLNGDWKAKITDFGLSIITSIDKDMDFVVDDACGTFGYVDPLYVQSKFLTRESDIYSLGVVLFEMMCGRMTYNKDGLLWLVPLAKRSYEEGRLDELVFEGIKDKIVPKSLTAFQTIAYRCVHDEREKRPTAGEVVAQLKEALQFQEEYEIWEPKLPRDFKEIILMSKTPVRYSNLTRKELYDMFCKGILLQEGKVWFSLSSHGKRNEMMSSKMFFYENLGSHKWRSMHKSRFRKVAKMMDVLNLNIQIKIKTQFLSSDTIYGAHLLFKFCDSRTISSKSVYVNLKYKIGGEVLHAYFATLRDDKWMSIELCRFLNHKEDTDFEVLLEGFSTYNLGNGAIYVEGIEFRAIDDDSLKMKDQEEEKLKEVQSVLESKPNMDYVEKLVTDHEEIINRSELDLCHTSKKELFSLLFDWILLDKGEKLFSLSKVNGKRCHMLPAKVVLHDSSNVKLFTGKHSAHSRFQEVFELLSHQAFRIKCKVESHLLSTNTKYVCYLVFKLSEECRGLRCPVKVRDLLREKKREFEIIYLRSPSPLNIHLGIHGQEQRQDGWMEVRILEFNVDNERKKSHDFIDLRLISYEGTMGGLIVYGLEFRPL